MLIKEILTIDLTEDIKNVIDLEDISESEIQTEIENYIVTEGLAREFANFASTYTLNISETGVWISGFYGSGKSYFGKLLGYLLSDKQICGTPARERILQRFTGINDESLVRNSLMRMFSENSRVVFLDIAKQDTSKGFSYTLFRNFLKSIDLPENEHGFFLFHLMKNEKTGKIQDFVFNKLNKDWADLKSNLVAYAKAAKNIYLELGHTESDYENMLTTVRRDIDQFGPSRLKDEVGHYLNLVKDEKIVFLFDEASEALTQKKYSLLDLEGVSEALSALGSKVWTIAIAQEKLDDVVNNSNISKAQLTKVTDRFKTKIHLESTEIDVIIRTRLLKKKDSAVADLKKHYQQNTGRITDHAAINAAGISKTETSESYITYYPFYKYQFDLLQNFLFGTKGSASTKVAARGMIITTYDILKREVQNTTLYNIASGWQIAREAQPQPSVRLVNRFDNAEKILKEEIFSLSGRKLLETIHFLSEAEVVPTTLPNILKSFISDPEDYHKLFDEVKKALDILTESKILLESNKTYRITSDIEQRLLDEMNAYSVQGFNKKKEVISLYKLSEFVKTLAKVSESGLQYDYYITTDNDDELTNPGLKFLKIKIKSIYSISDDRLSDIEALKTQHQDDKDVIWLVPENKMFREVDRLADDVFRIKLLEEKYKGHKSDEGPIVRSFTGQREEKEIRLKELIEQSLQQSTAIYLFNTYILNQDNWQSTMQAQQRLLIKNVYDKRLSSQLSDNVAGVVIKEPNSKRLHQFFHGDDFLFFDSHGNFIGDNLKVVEEIVYRIRNTFVDGSTLEKELELPPTGFSFGTVISAMAALMRAGKIMAKYNGAEKFSWRDEGVDKIFSNAREFRKASFKAISKSLSAMQKQDLAQFLLDMEVEKHTGRKVDFNTNDFELVNAVREIARVYCEKVTTMRNGHKDFDNLFSTLEEHKDVLCAFTGAVSEANYIEKAEAFLAEKEAYGKAVQAIEKVGKFIRNNLPKVREWNTFVIGVNDELTKAAITNPKVSELNASFNELYTSDIVGNFASLQQTAQKIKDEYHSLFLEAVLKSSKKYQEVEEGAKALIEEIKKLPYDGNEHALQIANSILHYASQRTKAEIELDYDVKDKHSRFSFSEVLSFIEIAGSKKTDLEIVRAGLIRESPPVIEPPVGIGSPPVRKPKKFSTTLPGKILLIKDYRSWLTGELKKISSANESDEVEIQS